MFQTEQKGAAVKHNTQSQKGETVMCLHRLKKEQGLLDLHAHPSSQLLQVWWSEGMQRLLLALVLKGKLHPVSCHFPDTATLPPLPSLVTVSQGGRVRGNMAPG